MRTLVQKTLFPFLLMASVCSSAAYDFKIPAGRMIFISDTQDTEPFQKLIGEEDNDAIRPQIAETIAKENPAALFHAGDIVNIGALEGWRSWNVFDTEFKPLTNKKTQIFPALGNHEYFGPDSWALENFFKRFPHLKNKRFYSVQISNALFLILDSNFKALHQHKLFERQLEWLEKTLEEARKDGRIRFVAAIFHHPPYTNAKSRYHETPAVRDYFLPLFKKCPKLSLVFTGHTHNYERFHKDGIHYVISGTGGGPRDPVLTGASSIHKDLTGDGRAVRDFGYLRVTPHPRLLLIEKISLREGHWQITDTLKCAL